MEGPFALQDTELLRSKEKEGKERILVLRTTAYFVHLVLRTTGLRDRFATGEGSLSCFWVAPASLSLPPFMGGDIRGGEEMEG